VIGALLFSAVRLGPLLLKLKWIPGWPMFLSQIMDGGCWIFLYIWTAPLWKVTQKQMKRRVVWCAVVAAFAVAMGILTSFFGGKQVSDYIYSPNRKNTAVIIENNASYGDSEAIFPVRGRFLYEQETGNYFSMEKQMGNAYTYQWIGENTLEIEFIIDGKDIGWTQYINW
jgi:hypothetical protein